MALLMNLGGITGGMSSPASHGWIELLSFKFDAGTQQVRTAPGSAGLVVDRAIATKLNDRASAWLMQLHLAGKIFPSCTVKKARGDAPNSLPASSVTLHHVSVVHWRTVRYPLQTVDEFGLAFERATYDHHSARDLSSLEAQALSKTWGFAD